MDSVRFSIEQDYQPVSHQLRDDNRDRLLKIEHKLTAISHNRQQLLKEDAQEQATRKVLALENNASEQIQTAENALRALREELSQLKVREAESTKRIQAARKHRAIELAELTKKINTLLAYEAKERRDSEALLVRNLEDKTAVAARELLEVQRGRTAQTAALEDGLSKELPGTRLAIELRCGQVEQALDKLHAQARGQVLGLVEEIEDKRGANEEGGRRVLTLLATVTEEIKRDLEEERASRKQTKGRLLSLLGTALAQLPLAQ